MERNSNELGYPVEHRVAALPARIPLCGEYTCLRPLAPEVDAESLWKALHGRDDVWAYMAEGPFATVSDLQQHLEAIAASADPLFYAVTVGGKAAGWLSLMRLEPPHRVGEVGNIVFSPALQRTREATEAIFLIADYFFGRLGYRRLEWKCNALNQASRKAAERFGFQYEGLFRQHRIVKGRNRDTAWFSLLEREWALRRAAIQQWLQPENFDALGQQRSRLARVDGSVPLQ